MTYRTPVWERFWEQVEIGDGCWTWVGCIVRGYGQFTISDGERIRAHRYAYEELVGPVPDGLVLDHLCRNRACVNPSHLEPVTVRENILRGHGVAAANAQKTHCPQGHEYTQENTTTKQRANGGGSRSCRTCARLYAARKRAGRVAA